MINIFVACMGAFEKLVCIKERNDMRVRETKLNIFMLGRLSTEWVQANRQVYWGNKSARMQYRALTEYSLSLGFGWASQGLVDCLLWFTFVHI